MSSRVNVTAVNVTVRAMRDAGQLEAIDSATVALARTTARALDSAVPGSSESASCARAHVVALDHLRLLSVHDDGNIDRMLDSFAVPPAVGDSADG